MCDLPIFGINITKFIKLPLVKKRKKKINSGQRNVFYVRKFCHLLDLNLISRF